MSESQLDSFLKSGNPPEAEAPAAPEAPRAAPESAPSKDAAPNGKAPAAAPAAPEPDDDADPGEARPGDQVVPRRAYETERQKRQNWVERASKAEAERDMLSKQLEEARKPPPPESRPPPVYEPIDPVRDPEGYTRRMRGVVLNERLNTSEMMALDKHGKEKVDAETAYFQQRTQADPRLWAELYSKPHPYDWMINNNATARLHEEIGTDPVAYEAKLRAKWEQERGDGHAPISPVAGMPPSLANARSSAPRGTNGFAGPMSMEDILSRPKRRG